MTTLAAHALLWLFICACIGAALTLLRKDHR